jgi:TonB family protein
VAWVDSAALHSDLARLSGPQAGAIVFSVRYSSAGEVERVGPIFQGYPDGYVRPLESALRAHLRRRSDREEPSVALLVQGGASPLIRFVRLGRAQAVPALGNGREVNAAIARATQTNGSTRGQTVVIGGVVAVDGALASPTVARSSGSTEVDREALRIARLMRFSPARIDGVAIQAPTSIPVTFQ